MDKLLHRDRDEQLDDSYAERGDREITLGTTMILAIFFALAVFAAVFFGFGYSMGSRRAAAIPAGASTVIPGVPLAGATKPAAGSPADTQAAAVPRGSSARASSAPEAAPEEEAADSSQSKHAPSVSAAAAAPITANAAQPVVQVAAVSHKEDADLLVSTLKARGYAVGIHTYPHDPLLHVQVGPFASHSEADAMRKRLIADGFNAIVKDPGR